MLDISASQILDKLDVFFPETTAPCPYDLPRTAVYRAAGVYRLPPELMGVLLAAGFRRNGNTIYTMKCPDCQACTPIRLLPDRFNPNRSQRRTLKKNRDITVEVAPLAPTGEKLALLEKFFRHRYTGRNNNAHEYYAGFFLTSADFSLEATYRLEGQLVGTAIIDAGATWMNAVYFFFDPDLAGRSLGTFNILQLLELCRKHGLAELYLGYWIDEVKAMRYKAAFLPHQLFRQGEWQTENSRRDTSE
jgi:arginine-tRNA-protein transferase